VGPGGDVVSTWQPCMHARKVFDVVMPCAFPAVVITAAGVACVVDWRCSRGEEEGAGCAGPETGGAGTGRPPEGGRR
jgi:hypothetical protein